MSYVLNNHLDNLFVLSNKAVGPGKKCKIDKRRAYIYSRVIDLILSLSDSDIQYYDISSRKKVFLLHFSFLPCHIKSI